VELNTAVRGIYEGTLLPMRNETSKWGDKATQLLVIKLVKKLWKKYKLPMHISFFKLYNMWANKSFKDLEAKEAKAAVKAAKAGNSKRRIEEVEEAEVSDEEPLSKRARSQKPVTTTKKTMSKTHATNPQPKYIKAGTTTKSAGKQAKTTESVNSKPSKGPARVGSDGYSLGIGPCRLGNDEDILAQGTIISLNPTMFAKDIEGRKISWPWNDGVLCRFTSPLQGRGTSNLIGSVFSVCTLHVIMFFLCARLIVLVD
jgi:uncharacterized protein YdaU (DUF1376 family)